MHLGGIPTVCGGRQGADSAANSSDLCYRFDPQLETWEQYGKVDFKSYSMAHDFSPEWGLVISGGYDGSPGGFDYLSYVEQTFDGFNFKVLPVMPEPLYRHCLVIVDEDTLFVSGGLVSSTNLNNTYLYR